MNEPNPPRPASALDRRSFLAVTATGALAAAAAPALRAAAAAVPTAPAVARAPAPFELPALPYADNALDPVISAQTISFHYGKHHRAYLDNMNKMVAGSDLEKATLEQVVAAAAAGGADKSALFNNAAQAWNHTFYWNSLTPGGGGKPEGELLAKLEASFGSFDKWKEEFAAAAKTQFGSGWAWLVQDGAALKVVKTANAETPLTKGMKPLLTLDVWEHAYYLDWQNRRPDYVAAAIDKLLNWKFAAANLAKA
ncbi:MAG: superoxide dismutase [Planctomycetes bacterium]|nr:superoxide dismutase [Planctomycetota bacterium]